MSRAEREKTTYDKDDISVHLVKWHGKFKHVFECPNTIRSHILFNNTLTSNIRGKKVLDIGCGAGALSQKLSSLGASYVHGIDISEKHISMAKQIEVKGQLDFSNTDIMKPVEGSYDAICGIAILHHVDYREVLDRIYHTNLNPGGFMLFMEPLGSNPLIKLYHVFSKSAHTPDEKPFYRKDLKWMRESFRNIEVIPINYFSFILGIVSSFIFARTDNIMMRLCDKIDCWIAKNIKFIIPYFRYGIFIIKKNHES